MITVILGFLKLSLQNYFRKEKLWMRLGLQALFILFALYNAFAIGLLLTKSDSKKILILQLILFGLGAMMILSIWFPSLSKKTNIIPEIFPFSGWQRAFIHWKLGFLGDGFIPFLVFLVSLFYFGNVTSLVTIGVCSSICLSFYAIKQFILTSLQSNLRNKLMPLVSLILIGIWGTIQVFKFKSIIPNYIGLIDWVLPVLGYLLVESVVKSTKPVQRYSRNFLGNWQSLQLFWRHNIARNSLLIGFGIKLLAIVAFGFQDESMKLIMFLFLSPIMSYNYVLNNTWGFYKSLWYNNELKSGSFSHTVSQYWTIVQFPLCIEVITSIGLVIAMGENYVANTLIVISSSIFFVATGLMCSNYFPKRIGSVMKLNGNTNQFVNLVCMVSIAPLALLKFHVYFYPIALLYALIGPWIIFTILKKDYKDKKHVIFNKLF